MKKRNYKDIRFIKNNDDTLTLEHLTSEMTVPCSGGGYILPVPCGGGKSTGITSLIKLFPDEGFILFEKTIKECDEAYNKLIAAGVKDEDIIVLHCEQQGNDIYKKKPELITKVRIVITPSINLYKGSRASLLAFHPKLKVDLASWLNDIEGLLCSEYVRRFILIDEQPDFIEPFYTIDIPEVSSHFGEMSSDPNGAVKKLSSNYYLHQKSLDWRVEKYKLISKSSKCRFFKDRSKISEYKSQEVLRFIHSNFDSLCKCRSTSHKIHHYIKDLICNGMKSNIYLFDATADVLSNYSDKSCPFLLISNTDKKYSSSIEFREFPMSVKRYLFDRATDDSSLKEELADIIDMLNAQICKVDGKLLIVTWKYMVSKCSGKKKADTELEIMRIIKEELDKRGCQGKYSIIYRGSGEDKATNAYQDFAAITFLGEWQTGRTTLTKINKNYGIKCKGYDFRLAAMIQTVSRIRIRKHEGQKIWVFYSSDIDKELMANLYKYFQQNSDSICTIEGMAVSTEKKDLNFCQKVMALCNYDKKLFLSISSGLPYTLNITLDEIYNLMLQIPNSNGKPKGKRKNAKARDYNDPLGTDLLSYYGVKLNITNKRNDR